MMFSPQRRNHTFTMFDEIHAENKKVITLVRKNSIPVGTRGTIERVLADKNKLVVFDFPQTNTASTPTHQLNYELAEIAILDSCLLAEKTTTITGTVIQYINDGTISIERDGFTKVLNEQGHLVKEFPSLNSETPLNEYNLRLLDLVRSIGVKDCFNLLRYHPD